MLVKRPSSKLFFTSHRPSTEGHISFQQGAVFPPQKIIIVAMPLLKVLPCLGFAATQRVRKAAPWGRLKLACEPQTKSGIWVGGSIVFIPNSFL